MQKNALTQLLQHKLSPQQIQFIKLLQVPTAELDRRVKEELEDNPVLDEGKIERADEENEDLNHEEEFEIQDYLQDNAYNINYKAGKNRDYDQKAEIPIITSVSLHERLLTQLGFLGLSEHQYEIGKQLVGSIENDGYIRRDLEAIVNDLAFSKEFTTTVEELEEVLKKIQSFDPAGIAARNLKECLLIQLDRMDTSRNQDVMVARQILTQCADEFFKKHYSKVIKKLGFDDEKEIKGAIELIIRLNPKPGGDTDMGVLKNQHIIPDFILTNQNGQLDLTLNARNAPGLKINKSYSDMFQAYDKGNKKDKKLKEVVSFMKQKLDSAKWFIDAIRQRQQTLLKTMRAILDFQFEYFLEGDENKLKPMILKDIATMIDMDISTVSRVVNSKTIQTNFGILPLKYFFSEGIATTTGEEVSNREVKQAMLELIEKEKKNAPLSDDKLESILQKKGYHIARRTVAKYREQLHIPVARLRKKLL